MNSYMKVVYYLTNYNFNKCIVLYYCLKNLLLNILQLN